MNTERTPEDLAPAEKQALQSVVTWIQVRIKLAKGERMMVQQTLPGMPRTNTNEYRIEPLGDTFDGYRIVDQDGNPLAIFAPIGEGATAEANTMFVQAMLETFNAVQQDILREVP